MCDFSVFSLFRIHEIKSFAQLKIYFSSFKIYSANLRSFSFIIYKENDSFKNNKNNFVFIPNVIMYCNLGFHLNYIKIGVAFSLIFTE